MILKHLTVLHIILLVIAGWSSCLGFTGYVIDAESKEPLPNVYIKDSTGKIKTITGRDGGFNLSSKSNNDTLLIISLIGYYSDTLKIISFNTLQTSPDTIYLFSQPTIVDGITVTANALSFRKQQKAGFETFQGNELYSSPGGFSDPLRYFHILPSVSFSTDYRNDLVVRGGNPSETAILVDGFEVRNINHFGSQGSSGGPFGMISSTQIEESSFSPGGFSVSYPNRLSSVMDIKLKFPKNKGLNKSIKLDLTGISGSIGLKNENNTSYLSAALRRSYLELLKDQLNLPSTPVYADALIKGSTLLPNNNILSFLTLFGYDRFELPAGNIGQYNPNDGEFHNDIDLALIGVKLITPISSKTLLETKYSLDYYRYFTHYKMTKIESSFINDSIERLHSFSSTATFFLNERFKLSSGVNYKYSNSNYRFLFVNFIDNFGIRHPLLDTLSNLNINQLSAFLELSTTISKLQIISGIRYDYHSVLKSGVLSPRGMAIYNINQNLQLFSSYGLYAQTPHDIWLAADPTNQNLPYFKATQFNIGFDFMYDSKSKLRVEAFIKRYLNYPTYNHDTLNTLLDFGTDFLFYEFRNINADGSGYSRGIETTLRRAFSNRLTGLLGLTLFTSKYKGSSGIELEGNFNNGYKLGLDINYTISDKFRTGLRLSSAGGKPYTPIHEWHSDLRGYTILDYKHINQEHYPPYNRLDFNIVFSQKIGSGQLSAHLDIINLYDRKNIWFYYWDDTDRRQATIYQWRIIPVAGISYTW